MIYFLYTLATIVGFFVYVAIGVSINGLYERRSLLKYGKTTQERMDAAPGVTVEWCKASREKDFVWVGSRLWPLLPAMYAVKLALYVTKHVTKYPCAIFIEQMEKLHQSVVHARLESSGAKSKDSKRGAYRSK